MIREYFFVTCIIVTMLTACNQSNNLPPYSKIWEFPTAIDTNYVKNKLNNPNIDHKVKGTYASNNLILDTNNMCYFYQKEPKLSGCCTEPSQNKIRFEDLRPEHLAVVPINDLKGFLDANLRRDFRGYILLMVSSPVDTIKQESFRILVGYIKRNSKNKILSGIRLMTEEERNVLYCKKKNIRYYFDDYKWEKTDFRSNIIRGE